MRFVVKEEGHRTTKLADYKTYQALLELIRTGNKDLITDNIYRDSYDTEDGKRSKVEDKLSLTYLNKCAYCERICKADIEHYRPKKGVTEQANHPGYYWLCYEWTNLLPACITCNREGSKHNHFPILGTRVFAPTLLPCGDPDLDTFKAHNKPLAEENPLLLHPEVDHPEDYFSFELSSTGEGIRLVGIDPEGRGAATIIICQLNRQELMLDRVERVIDDFKDAIQCFFVQLQAAEISEDEFGNYIIQQLNILKVRSLNEDKTHTYLRKYIVQSASNFEQIVLPFLEPGVKGIVLEAFKTLQ